MNYKAAIPKIARSEIRSAKTAYVSTIAENVINGGYGMNVLNYVNKNSLPVKVVNKALNDEFIEHGDAKLLRQLHGINTEEIVEDIIKWSK